MKIVSWNINSLRVRQDQVLDWIEAHVPDVICMQETKMTDQEFPEDEFGDLDYDVVYYGQPAYNGVAIATRSEPEDVVRGFGDDTEDSQRRYIACTVDGIRIHNVYCPNGYRVGSDKYEYKLAWFDQLHQQLAPAFDREAPVILCGDFNIAPEDRDLHDPTQYQLFRSEPERAAIARLCELGMKDAFRAKNPDQDVFSWWDYRDAAFERGEGLRIDHFFITDAVLSRTESCLIDVEQRMADKASDHAPIILEIED